MPLLDFRNTKRVILAGLEPEFSRSPGEQAHRAREVQHYRFLGGSSRDWLAEREHIALIEAYNALTPDALFTQQDDVECLEYYEFCMQEDTL